MLRSSFQKPSNVKNSQGKGDTIIKTPKRKQKTPTVPNGTPPKIQFQPQPFEHTRQPTQESQLPTLSTSKHPHPFEELECNEKAKRSRKSQKKEQPTQDQAGASKTISQCHIQGLPTDIKQRISEHLSETNRFKSRQIFTQNEMGRVTSDIISLLTKKCGPITRKKVKLFFEIAPHSTLTESIILRSLDIDTKTDNIIRLLKDRKLCEKSQAFTEALLDRLLNKDSLFQTNPRFAKKILVNVLKNKPLCQADEKRLGTFLETITKLDKALQADYLVTIFQQLTQQPADQGTALFKAILDSRASYFYVFTNFEDFKNRALHSEGSRIRILKTWNIEHGINKQFKKFLNLTDYNPNESKKKWLTFYIKKS